MNAYLLLLFYCVTCCNGANILYAMAYTAKSHDIFLRPIALELARRGHNVTTITMFEEKNPPPNYHQILIEKKEIWEILGQERMVILEVNQIPTTYFLDLLWYCGLGFTKYLLNSPTLQDFLKNDNKFDLVISENFLVDATTILAHKYNAPLVLVATFGHCMRHNIAVGNPVDLTNVPYEYIFLEDPRSLIGRLKNLYITAYEYIGWRYWYLEEQMKLVRQYIPGLSHSPSLYEIHRNASLFLVNSHFSFHNSKAYLPNIKEIGGLHLVSDDDSLSEDVEKVLNESKHGVIYINFGSVVQSMDMSREKKNAFLNNLKKLNHTVLWKWEDTEMEGKPANVIIRKWFPQRKILAHPNVKLFICHGGMLGVQEAIYHGVPILGVPVFGDQYNNLYLAEQAGYGKILKYDDINENSLNEALNEIITPRYLDNAKVVSRRFRDRPTSALDAAVFWINYVLRTNGEALKVNATENMEWLVYEAVDILLYFIIPAFVSICIVLKLIRYILFAKSETPQTNKEKIS